MNGPTATWRASASPNSRGWPIASSVRETVSTLRHLTARAQDDFGPPLFEEVWTLFKGKFYDRTMNGVDWEALRKKYLPAAKAAQTPEAVRAYVQAVQRTRARQRHRTRQAEVAHRGGLRVSKLSDSKHPERRQRGVGERS